MVRVQRVAEPSHASLVAWLFVPRRGGELLRRRGEMVVTPNCGFAGCLVPGKNLLSAGCIPGRPIVFCSIRTCRAYLGRVVFSTLAMGLSCLERLYEIGQLHRPWYAIP